MLALALSVQSFGLTSPGGVAETDQDTHQDSESELLTIFHSRRYFINVCPESKWISQNVLSTF